MKMRGSQRGKMLTIEVGVITILAIMCLSSLPSLAQQDANELGNCWASISDCITSHANDTSNPKFDPTSPSFDASEYLCCSLINETARTDKPCFCSIGPVLHHDPAGPNVTTILTFCNTTTSLASFDAFCAGSMPPAEAPILAPIGSPVPLFG